MAARSPSSLLARCDPHRGRAEARQATRRPGDPPESDYRYLDRLEYMLDARLHHDHVAHLWLVDAASGDARELLAGTDGGGEIGLVARWHPDCVHRQPPPSGPRPARPIRRVHGRCRDGRVTPITGGGDSVFLCAGLDARRVDDRRHRRTYPWSNYRAHLWRFAADGSDARPMRRHGPPRRQRSHACVQLNSDATIGEGGRLCGPARCRAHPVHGAGPRLVRVMAAAPRRVASRSS